MIFFMVRLRLLEHSRVIGFEWENTHNVPSIKPEKSNPKEPGRRHKVQSREGKSEQRWIELVERILISTIRNKKCPRESKGTTIKSSQDGTPEKKKRL